MIRLGVNVARKKSKKTALRVGYLGMIRLIFHGTREQEGTNRVPFLPFGLQQYDF